MEPERLKLSAAQRALVLANLDLITWAARYGPGSFAGNLDRDEIRSIAGVTLVESAANWIGSGTFRAHARAQIRHAIIDYCRHTLLLDRGRKRKRTLPLAPGLIWPMAADGEERVAVSRDKSPEQQAHERLALQKLSAHDGITERHRRILREWFGNRTQQLDIAVALKLSKPRVCQLLDQALERARKLLKVSKR